MLLSYCFAVDGRQLLETKVAACCERPFVVQYRRRVAKGTSVTFDVWGVEGLCPEVVSAVEVYMVTSEDDLWLVEGLLETTAGLATEGE